MTVAAGVWLGASGVLPGAIALAEAGALPGAEFRVEPYLQNPAPDAMTVVWLSNSDAPGTLSLAAHGPNGGTLQWTSTPVLADSLGYHPSEPGAAAGTLPGVPGVPYLHRVRVTGLAAGTAYDYTVTQGDATRTARLTTAPTIDTSIRFMVYADSETEPESTGKFADWPDPTGATSGRKYLADQTAGYQANLAAMASRSPHFIAVAGDLVESGGEQRDWDEFWRHNAGDLGRIASSVPIVAAIGNHENYGGPGALGGYSDAAAVRGIAKFKTYFETPANAAANPAHHGRYHRLDYGPVTLITLDTSKGSPHQSASDTNWHLANADGAAPDFNPGSPQYQWLETQLADARDRGSKFIFVQFHHAPYSVGPHGQTPAVDKQSGLPVRVLTPLFKQYGVSAVFAGHDEMYERSLVDGIHFYDVGIGGDGLRGPVPGVDNPHQLFLAHTHAPEVWDANILQSGGKHYGHLEVNVFADPDGTWKAQLLPVYLFPVMNEQGQVIDWQRHLYEDAVTLTAIPEPASATACLVGLMALTRRVRP